MYLWHKFTIYEFYQTLLLSLLFKFFYCLYLFTLY